MKTIVLCILACFAGLPVAVAEEGWLTDMNAARKQAAEQKTPILVNFTGSDWCGWCIRLDKEVFSTETFKAYARKNLVLVKIDFPRRKLPEKQAKANQALAETYAIQGFPTIVLTDASGKELAQTGYRQGGPDAYVAHLEDLLGKKE